MPNDNVLTPERRFHFANRMIHIDDLEDRIALVRAIEREVLAAHPGQPEPRAEVTDDDKLCASRYRWLSRQSVATHSRDDLNCRWEVDYVLYGESFDAAIDAARTGASS